MEIFPPGSTIVHVGEPGNAIYFISKGEVAVYSSSSSSPIDKLYPGEYFGDLSLILNEPRTGTVKCNDFTEVFVLKESEFSRIKSDFKEFTQTLKEVSKKPFRKGSFPVVK